MRCEYDWLADYIAADGDSDVVGIGFLRTNSDNRADVGSPFVNMILSVLNEMNGVGAFCMIA